MRTHDKAENSCRVRLRYVKNYYRGYGNNVRIRLLKNCRLHGARTVGVASIWEYEREHFCPASSLVSLPSGPRARQARARAPHRMNNWNNAERKRGAVPWRSRNIDRKITIGLKPESLVVVVEKRRTGSDQPINVDDQPWNALSWSQGFFYDPRLPIVSREIRCTLVNKAIKTRCPHNFLQNLFLWRST